MRGLILPLMIIPLPSVADPVPPFETLPLRAAPARVLDRAATPEDDAAAFLQPDIAVAADDVVSLMWYMVAFEMGQHPSSRDILLGRSAAELPTQDHARAEAMAQSCVESAFVDCSWPRRRTRGFGPIGWEGPLTAPCPSPIRPIQVLTRRRFIANPALRSGEKA